MAEFKFKSKFKLLSVIWQSLQKVIPEENWSFWLQNQWPSSWVSAPALLGQVRLASTNTGSFAVAFTSGKKVAFASGKKAAAISVLNLSIVHWSLLEMRDQQISRSKSNPVQCSRSKFVICMKKLRSAQIWIELHSNWRWLLTKAWKQCLEWFWFNFWINYNQSLLPNWLQMKLVANEMQTAAFQHMIVICCSGDHAQRSASAVADLSGWFPGFCAHQGAETRAILKRQSCKHKKLSQVAIIHCSTDQPLITWRSVPNLKFSLAVLTFLMLMSCLMSNEQKLCKLKIFQLWSI